MADSQAHRIARAIDLLKRRYAEAMRMEEVAEAAHMIASSLHHHFKQMTSMAEVRSPADVLAGCFTIGACCGRSPMPAHGPLLVLSNGSRSPTEDIAFAIEQAIKWPGLLSSD